MLVSEVIDATYLEWLYPSGVEQPLYDVLAEDLASNDSDLTVALEGRAESVPRDSVLEIGSELLLAKEVSGTAVTLQERAFLSTTLAAHTAGAQVIIDPTYPRVSVFNALRSVVGLLFPWGLYSRGIDTSQTFTTAGVLSLPADAKKILSILVRKNTADETYDRLVRRGVDWIEYREFDPPKYHLRRGGNYGQPMRIVYMKDFTLPTAEADDLDDLGVPETLQPDLSMAVAGHLLRGKELPRVQVEEIRTLLASQGVQVGQAMNIGQALIQAFQRTYVAAERRRQSELDEPTFEFVRS